MRPGGGHRGPAILNFNPYHKDGRGGRTSVESVHRHFAARGYQCGRPAILEPALAVWRGGDLMSEEFVHIEKGLGPNGRIAVVRFDRARRRSPSTPAITARGTVSKYSSRQPISSVTPKPDPSAKQHRHKGDN